MKPLVVAVSGGVDSVVLLDKLTHDHACEDSPCKHIVVAHFDHGIRADSDADARFVKGLAQKYNVPFEVKREELGMSASEEKARTRRHSFLRDVARKHGGQVVTAHHSNDVVETIAINLYRGTGWRGLAVLDDSVIARPLIDMTKQEIRDYALKQQLEWVEDETNVSDMYLRNRLRRRITAGFSSKSKSSLLKLWQEQWRVRREIQQESKMHLASTEAQSRYLFTHIDESVASELLWTVLHAKGLSLTTPQRTRLLHAIKTAKAGSQLEAGAGVTVNFFKTTFIVETP